ncbi:hypothetical protein FU658_08085, partial [Alkalisalibacterium limincola]
MPASAITEPGTPSPARWIAGLLAPHRRWRWLAALASLGAGLAIVAQAGALAWLVSAAIVDAAPVPKAPWILAFVAVLSRFGLQAARDACGAPGTGRARRTCAPACAT